MKTCSLLGGALGMLVAAASLAAQETPQPEPDRPQARMRLHAPGTGLRSDMTPMRLQRGMQQGRMSRTGFGDRAFSPRALVNRRVFLELSDQQVAELEKLDAAVTAARDKALADAKTHDEALVEAWKADKPDAKAIREHALAAMRAHQEVQLEALTAAARAKAALTPEQLGKVRGFSEGQRARMGARGRVGAGRGARMQPRGRRAPRPGRPQGVRRPEVL
jgi:Spy/CpxP family protein refolding chaperone